MNTLISKEYSNMRIHSCIFIISFVALFSSSDACAFEYFDDFERYQIDFDAPSEYNKKAAENNSVVFSNGFSKRFISLNDPVHAIDEEIPNSPKNSKIVQANPSKLRKGNCKNCVMKFVNKGSLDLSKDSWSEQRFSLNSNALPKGKKGLTNFWLQYDQYIPENYHHRGTMSGGGRKVLSIFSDGYSVTNGIAYPTFVIGARPISTVSHIDYAFQTHKPGASKGARRFTLGALGEIKKMIVNPSIDLGHWQRRTLHLRMPTSEGSNDGVIEFWVQRLAETNTPMAPEKLLEKKNGNFYGGARNYLNKGYLLGYSDAGYNHDVTFLLDNLIITDKINSIDSSAIDLTPNSPTDVSID